MSALARYFKDKGSVVKGYDKTPTILTRQLEAEGISVNYDDKIDLLDKEAELVIFTPAIPKTHRQFNYYMDNQYRVLKRSEVLGMISNNGYSICVAGTHGKTTISTMIAHILEDSNYGCTAFLGGISVNYSTNYWSGNDRVFVVEADEYDRSFLKLQPDVAVISAIDSDHLEIYGNHEGLEKGFTDFAGKIKAGGLLISKYGLKSSKDLNASKHLRYSLINTEADIYASNITVKNGSYHFDIMQTDLEIQEFILNIGGLHNIENAIAAISVARYLKIPNVSIKKAINSFKGVKRRFEYVISPESKVIQIDAHSNMIFIDDYAHHPEELRSLILSARDLFANRLCTIIFQPHLFSRTKYFYKEFASALDLADEVILLPIYPARELPVEGVTSELILNEMLLTRKRILDKDQLITWIKTNPKLDVLITAGAGDIDQLVEPIKNTLNKLNNFE